MARFSAISGTRRAPTLPQDSRLKDSPHPCGPLPLLWITGSRDTAGQGLAAGTAADTSASGSSPASSGRAQERLEASEAVRHRPAPYRGSWGPRRGRSAARGGHGRELPVTEAAVKRGAVTLNLLFVPAFDARKRNGGTLEPASTPVFRWAKSAGATLTEGRDEQGHGRAPALAAGRA
jgi:hypothetical protein